MRRLTYSIATVLSFLLLSSDGVGPGIRALAATVDPHAYFDALVGRADHWKSASLRDPAELETKANGGYAACNKCPLQVTYDPARDPDPRRQDAAKVVVPTSSNSLQNYLAIPLGTQDGHSYFFTWDSWLGAEHRSNISGILTWKHFQITGRISAGGNPQIWFETRSRFDQAQSPFVAMVDTRSYNPAMQPIGSQSGTFALAPETWTRYWILLEQSSGADRVSLWVADTTRGPVQILNRVSLENNGLGNEFWFEYNTSLDAIQSGRPSLVSYIRNFAVLLDTPAPTSLLARPLSAATTSGSAPTTPQNLRITP